MKTVSLKLLVYRTNFVKIFFFFGEGLKVSMREDFLKLLALHYALEVKPLGLLRVVVRGDLLQALHDCL